MRASTEVINVSSPSGRSVTRSRVMSASSTSAGSLVSTCADDGIGQVLPIEADASSMKACSCQKSRRRSSACSASYSPGKRSGSRCMLIVCESWLANARNFIPAPHESPGAKKTWLLDQQGPAARKGH